ncbi:TIGR04086 family membrane protein [Iocasia frigidifontis]|uniref:TIGR04086 family membrane protein n=1 Tax=Iocasia fonsfrigidae TaxID=2682810 RepID=A0A8A7K9C6_9FIRM|nr:TIGR04086 family membrane protein [Iocasia fonsfrigidae]QTL98356.1 TIGR04086 family membrane protein [Iocasia fonsfrigidae]
MFEKMNENKSINNIIIFKVVLLGIIVLLFLSIIMAIFSRFFFSLQTNTLNTILIITNFLIIILIGFFAARKVENNGWLHGGLSGLIYMLIMILIGIISIPVSIWHILLLSFIGLLVGSIGGIIGINF